MAAPSPRTASDLSPGEQQGLGTINGHTRRTAPFLGPSPHKNGQPIRELGLMRGTGEHDTARFVGSGSGIHFIRNVHLRLARRTADRQQQNVDQLVPGEDDQLRSAQGNIWKACEVAIGEPKVTFDQLVEWSKSYFESWHPVMPFLHGPDVLGIFQTVSISGLEFIGILDRSILRAVLSISLADSRQLTPIREPVPQSLLFGSVDEAVAQSQFALSQPASVRSTQAAVAIQLFLMSMLCLNAASRLGGLIVRMAFHLGLHRCPTRYPFFNAKEGSERRRLFWCIYSSERFLSQSLGVPLDIHGDDLDVCYPGEETHGNSANRDPPATERDHRLQLLFLVARHAGIRGLILELRNKCADARQDTVDHGIAVQAELAKWFNEVQDLLEEHENDIDIPAENSPVKPMHRLMLSVLKHESMISLNRPLMASDSSAPSYSAALQACISAAKSICSATKRHLAKYKLSEPLLWPSFTWSIWISAFVLGYAAFEHQISVESALKHIRSGQESLRHIASRNTTWPEYCLSAIEELISSMEELPHTVLPSARLQQSTENSNGPRKRHFSTINDSQGNPTLTSSGPALQDEQATDGLPHTNPDHRLPTPLECTMQSWANSPRAQHAAM